MGEPTTYSDNKESKRVGDLETTAGLPLAAALKTVKLFADLSDEQLEWFASRAEDRILQPGEILFTEGQEANALCVVLDGEIVIRREAPGSDGPAFFAEPGDVPGLLPYSRMTHFPLSSRAVVLSRVAWLHKDNFPEMMQRIPELTPRLVSVMADRVRISSQAQQQQEKLMALGKLSAGLAHELNNPASAAVRASENLRDCMSQIREINRALDGQDLKCEDRLFLLSFEDEVVERSLTAPALDPLDQSDREDELVRWLRKNGVKSTQRIASGLVEAGVTEPMLHQLSGRLAGDNLERGLTRIVASTNAARLTREIEASTSRISELVRAIKEYSYMDQAQQQEVNIHQGLDNTLTMMKFRLKKGVEVVREYHPNLPPVYGNGGELNQVWTNLIDNAVDAMDGKGKLVIKTAHDLDWVEVQIIDNGPGIPESAKAHLFEPFFTTKDVGKGTGLGLDIVYRIVRGHHGNVAFESEPGRTAFCVCLPVKHARRPANPSNGNGASA